MAATKGCIGEIEGLDGLMKWLVFAAAVAAGGGEIVGSGRGFDGTRGNTFPGGHMPETGATGWPVAQVKRGRLWVEDALPIQPYE